MSKANETWEYLANTYKQNTAAPAYMLFSKMIGFNISQSNSPTEYTEKMTELGRELNELGWKIDDAAIAGHMLYGLSDKYSTLVSDIQNIPSEQWSVESVKNRILTYKTPDAKPSASTNLTRNKKRKWKDGDKNKDDAPTCKHCQKTGHLEKDCWNKHPDKKPKWMQSKQRANTTKTDKETLQQTS